MRTAAWKWLIRAPAIIAAVSALLYFGTPIALGPRVIADPVVRADFVQNVVASGHVEAPFRVNVGSQITGVVADIPVDEGQTVKAGDTLIVLDDREARAALVQAEGAAAQAEARIRQMREVLLPSAQETLRQAQATLANAQAVYDRASQLAKSGIATRATLDDATRALNIARAQVRSAELQVHTNSPGGSDYVIAHTLLNQAHAALASAKSRLSYTVIKAPRDGVLISRDVERGNVVQPSNVLMKLSPTGKAQLVVQIDEKNLGLIALGQRALASADAFPKETFEARIAYINPGIDLQRASVQVKLDMPHPPAYLRQDMTVSVDIETARHPNALIIPAECIRGISTGKPWALKVEDGRAKRQPVTVGLVSAGKAEVLDGLEEGDLVLPASAPVKEGGLVRAYVAPARTP
jgi:HlyD family secretion protein